MKLLVTLMCLFLSACAAPTEEERVLSAAETLVEYQCRIGETADRIALRYALNRVLYPDIVMVKCGNLMPPLNAMESDL